MHPAAPGPLPDAGARTPRERRLWTLLICLHLLAMAASLTKKTAVGAAVRSVTAPYERLLGAWQSWGMFGPNPPLGTSWLVVEGTTRSGAVVDLPAPVGEKPFDRTDWHYSRIQKVERNMFDKTNHSLRQGYAAWLCRTRSVDDPLVEVRIRKDRHMTPAPGERGGDVVVKPIPLETVACPEPGA